MNNVNEINFEKMSVKDLRTYIVKNKLFKNLGNLKKGELISKINEALARTKEVRDQEKEPKEVRDQVKEPENQVDNVKKPETESIQGVLRGEHLVEGNPVINVYYTLSDKQLNILIKELILGVSE